MISRRPFFKFPLYLLGLGSELAGPLLRFGAKMRAPGPVRAPAQWRSGLIIGHTHIGDVLYRTCSLEYLKKGLPHCEWSYLAAPDSAEVLQGNPWLKEVLPLRKKDSVRELAPGAWGALGRKNFDVALCTDAQTYWVDLGVALRLGIPNRAGYTFRGLSGLVTHPVPCAYPSSRPAYFRGMVGFLTGQPADWPLVPRIYATAADEAVAERVWQRHRLRENLPVLVCGMTHRQTSIIWPKDYYREMVAEVRRKRPIQLVAVGASTDKEVLEAFVRQCGMGEVIAGELNLRELYCFFKRCTVSFSPDTGIRHIANAAGIPAVFIRSLSCSKVEAGSYCETETDVSPPVEFVPVADQERILRGVTPPSVAGVVLEKMEAEWARRARGGMREAD